VKKHLAIVTMANSASISATGIEVLAVERLYYGTKLNGALSVFLLFSSQFFLGGGYRIAGTAVGAVLNYTTTNEIIDNNFETLLSIEGTMVWSGQQAQAFKSLAVAWGCLSHELFSVGGTYQWMTLIFIPNFFVPIPF
jgi:hypothetical protein